MTDSKDQQKSWPVIKITDSWQIFKIMAEFVKGFETLSSIGPGISLFGSARSKPGDPYYEMAEVLGEKLALKGYAVITGGGPGIMEAGNKGAKKAKGSSVGVSIDLPFETKANDFVDHDKHIHFDYFFVRKVMLVKYAQAFVVFPGGLGTMDELFEALTLIQTQKIKKFPIVLMGKNYWKGLLDWMKETMLQKEHFINEHDLFLFEICDTPDEAIRYIDEFYKTDNYNPNF